MTNQESLNDRTTLMSNITLQTKNKTKLTDQALTDLGQRPLIPSKLFKKTNVKDVYKVPIHL